MFSSAFSRVFRPTPGRASQCMRQHLLQLAPPRRNPIQLQMRQQKRQYQSDSKRSAASSFALLWRTHPYSVTTALVWYVVVPMPPPFHKRKANLWVNSIIVSGSLLLYTNVFYNNYIIGAFHQFPEPVAKQMRKALYYTNMAPDTKLALKYYKEALRVADEIGMDPFSDEIIGVKIQVAALMEKVQQYQRAIDVLEIVKADNLKWMEKLGDKPGNEAKKTRVLKMTVRVSVKLGELYANEYVLEKELAEDRLVWAVETVLREQQRREKEGVKPEEGEWFSVEEHRGALESRWNCISIRLTQLTVVLVLAHTYEEKNLHYLAAPLFLQAIILSPPSSCHTAVLSKSHPNMA